MSVLGEERIMHEFLVALRRQVSATEVIGSAVALGALGAFTDFTPSVIVIFAGLFVLVTVINALGEMPGVKGRALSAVVFSAGTLCGIYLTVTEPSYAMGGLTFVVGWLTLDALYDAFHGIDRSDPLESELDEMSARESTRAMHRAGQVQQALRRAPTSLSTLEIATRTELSETEVNEALSLLENADTILEERGRYEIDEDRPGLIRSTLRRIARPFSLFTPSR